MIQPENQAEALDEKALRVATQAVTDEIDRYWQDDAVEPGHRPVAKAAIRAYLASLPEAPAVPVGVSGLAEAVEFTRADLGETGTNYPHVRTLLAFAEAGIQSSVDGDSDISFEQRIEWAENFLKAYADGNREKLLGGYDFANAVRHLAGAVQQILPPALASQNAVEGEAVADGPEEIEIDRLRLAAFKTNSNEDKAAYYLAVSKWFQDRHYRRSPRPAAADAGVREALDSCICLLETMAETAKERGDTAEWSMMSVMAENGRAALSLAMRGQAE
jgi:hypothetical protein